MGVIFSFIIVLVIMYYVYLAAQKREVPIKLPYGFCSLHAWKVAMSLVTYFIIIVFFIAFASGPDNKINDKNNSLIEPTVTSGPKLKVHYIDVGQADCILIQIPNGKNVLIDAGNNADSSTVVSYLQNQRVKRLDVVVGTHPHEDHIGSLDTVINTFDIGQVVMPKKASTTRTYSNVITAIINKGLKITEAKAGLQLSLGNEVVARLLAPNSTGYDDVNDCSAVLQLVYGKNIFLFSSDANALSENEMMNTGYDLRADVLKVGHHGSSSATTSAFLNKVSPKYAVISVGKGNSYGHPTQATLDKLANAGVKVYRTNESGTIIAESDGSNITFRVLGASVQPRPPNQE